MALSKKSKVDTIENGNLEDSGYKKPSMSYAQLIAEALNNAPEKTLVLSDIYKAINAKYPYYELETQGWQNSLRHTLTLNKSFIREKKDKDGLKRGWLWKLSEGHSIPAVGVKKRDHICSCCNIGFASQATLKKHTIAMGHKGKLQKSENSAGMIEYIYYYYCSHCSEGFTSPDELKYHVAKVHSFVQEGKLQKSEDSHEALADKSILENTMDGNPWLVRNIQAFSFFNCPECTFKVKEENLFQDHAVKNHSLSSVLFGANIKTECVYIKTEPNEDIIEHPMIETEPNEDVADHQMIKSELHENIRGHQIVKAEPDEDFTEHQTIDPLNNVISIKNEPLEQFPDLEKKASNFQPKLLNFQPKLLNFQPKLLKRRIGTIETSIGIEIPPKLKKDFYHATPYVGMQDGKSTRNPDQTNIHQTTEKFNSISEPDEDLCYDKPSKSYAQLIAEALNNAPEKTLVLSDIYKAINTKHPYYDLKTQGWQNSIRQMLTRGTLSRSKNFIKGISDKGLMNWSLPKHQDICDTNISSKNGERNAKRENRLFVSTDECGNQVFSCSKCGMKFSGFRSNGKHMKKCWNNAS